MGKELNCYLDPSAKSFKLMFRDLTEEKKPPEPDPPAQPLQPPPPPVSTKVSPDDKPEEKSSGSPRRGGGAEDRYDRRSVRDPRSQDSRERRRSSSDHRTRDGGGSKRDYHHHHSRRDRDWRQSEGGSSSRRGDREASPEEQVDTISQQQPPPPPPSAVAAPPPPLPLHQSSHMPGGEIFSKSATGGDGDCAYQPTTFDPQYSQPEYWLEQARHYAAAAAAVAQRVVSNQDLDVPPQPPPPEPPDIGEKEQSSVHTTGNNSKAGSDVENERDDDDVMNADHKVDLDTRLKMLMKDRSGAMPAFLLSELNDSEEEEENEELEGAADRTSSMVFPLAPDEVPLSRPPSPFLSAQHYLDSHQRWVAARRVQSQNSDMPDQRQALAASDLKSAKTNGKRPTSRNSDQMSLSSLSSAENNVILDHGGGYHQQQHHQFYGYYPAGFQQPYAYGQTDQYGHFIYDPNMPPPHMQYEGYYDPATWAQQYGDYGQIKQSKDAKANIRPLIRFVESVIFRHIFNIQT